MRAALGDGELSVALEMNLTHAAPKGVQGAARAVATYRGVAGRVHRFTVHVFDESGLIASAEHSRAVVAEPRSVALERRRAIQLNV
jgi:predicted thioesterase